MQQPPASDANQSYGISRIQTPLEATKAGQRAMSRHSAHVPPSEFSSASSLGCLSSFHWLCAQQRTLPSTSSRCH